MIDRSVFSLEKRCKEFIRKEYNINLDIPVRINNRLSRSLGRFVITRGNIDNRIEFAGYLLKEGTDEQIISVLKHECIHYVLYQLGRDFKDGQKDFENELKRHGAGSTNSIRIKKKDDVVIDKELADELTVSIGRTIENVFDRIIQEKVAGIKKTI